MKTLFTFFAIFLTLQSYSQQNQSAGGIQNAISSPSPIPNEIFRFQPGVVTQLDQGSSFSPSSQFFRLGRIPNGSQIGYALNFVTQGRGLSFGYTDISSANPRVVWKGTDASALGNLEFRYAPTFAAGSTNLSATMRNDGSTVFGFSIPAVLNDSKVGINSESRYGLRVMQNTSGDDSFAGYFENFSTNVASVGAAGISLAATDSNIGVLGKVVSAGSLNNIGVYGTVGSTDPGVDFAGFFDGDVEVVGTFTNPSDKKLKTDIESESNALSKLSELNPVTYTFKANKNLNLAKNLQHGFIAQELEKVYPELVHTINKPILDEDGKYQGVYQFKSFNYLGLISVLTSSIKELSAEVETLKKGKQTYVVYGNSFSEVEMDKIAENGYKLEQNYPNPFDSSTTIKYSLPENEKNASIMILNMNGNLLKEYKLNQKEGEIKLDAQDFRKGILLYSLISKNTEIITKKMIIR